MSEEEEEESQFCCIDLAVSAILQNSNRRIFSFLKVQRLQTYI